MKGRKRDCEDPSEYVLEKADTSRTVTGELSFHTTWTKDEFWVDLIDGVKDEKLLESAGPAVVLYPWVILEIAGLAKALVNLVGLALLMPFEVEGGVLIMQNPVRRISLCCTRVSRASRILGKVNCSNSSISIQLQYALGLIIVSVSMASCKGEHGFMSAISS